MTMKLSNVRLSFANIWKKTTPKGAENSEPKYDLTVLIKKNDPQLKMLLDAIEQIKADHAPFPPSKWTEICLFDGDTSSKAENKEGERYAGYEGHYALRLKNKKSFPVVDKDLSQLTEDDGRIYSGCFVNVAFYLSGYKNYKCISGFVKGLQFHADGEAFGSSDQSEQDVTKMFENEAGEIDIQDI